MLKINFKPFFEEMGTRLFKINIHILLSFLFYLAKNNIVICDFSCNVVFSKRFLNIKCAFGFPVQTLSETFCVRRTERDIIINGHTYSCKTFVIIGRFSLKLNILHRFLKNKQVLIFKLSVQ